MQSNFQPVQLLTTMRRVLWKQTTQLSATHISTHITTMLLLLLHLFVMPRCELSFAQIVAMCLCAFRLCILPFTCIRFFLFLFSEIFSQIFFLKVEIWRFHLVAAGVGASFDVVVIIAADIQLHSCAHRFVVIVVVWWHCCHSHLLYCVLCSCFASFSCSSKDTLCV